ncbi:MAG: flagellar assembly protein FliX [Pseudomonadota bacterium]
MEIRPPGFNRIQKNTGPAKKGGKTESKGFADAMDERSSAPVHQSAAVFSVDPMFANLDEPSPEQKGIQKGLSLLDELEKLRGQLLCGNIEPESIMTIQNYVKQLRSDETDDRLQDLLLEIETRAVVELAKHRMRGIAHPL